MKFFYVCVSYRIVGMLIAGSILCFLPKAAFASAVVNPDVGCKGECIEMKKCQDQMKATPGSTCTPGICNPLNPGDETQGCYVPPSEVGSGAGAAGNGAGTAGKGSTTKLVNPLGEGATFFDISKRVISMFLGMVGALALLVFVWAGITWMTAGSSERVQKAKDMMKYAVIGIALIAFSYVLASKFVDMFSSGA